VRLYINGVEVTSFSSASYPSQNLDLLFNSTNSHEIGRFNFGSYLDGYLTEINLIDGQALTPSSFGETNPVTGVWQPKKYAGTYGTNGFFLNFSDPSAATAAAIGKDYSGNGNNWTPNNISVTSGSTYDSMLDVPTLWADGGNGRGNYPTWNPLTAGGLVTFSEANLKALSTSASAPFNIESTIKTPTSGKWYAEVTMAVGASNPAVGIGNNPSTSNSNTDQFAAYRVNATYVTSGMGASSSGTPATFTTNDVIGIAYDADAGTLVFYKNGTLQSGGFTGITAGNYSFIVRKDSASGDGGTLNAGQRPFAYTPPTGFKALNTQNLPEPVIKKGNQWFDVKLYTGNGTSQTISGLAFSPDLVWQKTRTGTGWHNLVDQVRGAGYRLFSNTTNAESYAATNLTAFTSDGFSIGSDGDWNTNASANVAWNWKEGATPGFDIVTYTGNGSTQNVNHSLGTTPRMIVIKDRTTSENWYVYHASLGTSQALRLNSTIAAYTPSPAGVSAVSSTTFTLGGARTETNTNADSYVAYLFAEVAGFSKFGSYTGNGSTDGPFVFTGFRPRWVMVKKTNSTGSWAILDSARDTYNQGFKSLYPDLSNAEVTIYDFRDFLSNGFKLRATDQNSNGNGDTYIYAAFAENPFKYSLAR